LPSQRAGEQPELHEPASAPAAGVPGQRTGEHDAGDDRSGAPATAAPRGGGQPLGVGLLDVRGLHVHYRVTASIARRRLVVRAVNGVSLELARGETLGLVGESGSGKSTLAKSLIRLEPVTSGEIYLDGTNIVGLSERAFVPMRRRIQMIFQDSLNSLNPRFTLADTLSEPFIVHHLAGRAELRDKVAELLVSVGLGPEMMDQSVTELSGGQRQRVNIARALAPSPEVIVADEPTSSLDVSVQAQVLNLMRDLQRQTAVSYVFISHDLGVVRRMASRVAVMYLGKIVETAGRDLVYTRPLHPYTRALLQAAPRPDPRRERQRQQAPIPGEVPTASEPPPGCGFHPRCPLARAICRTDEPPLRPVESGHWSACHFAEELQPAAAGPADSG
jgi:oligopeptide/dipeptide ABC transporter ATP-binding protein